MIRSTHSRKRLNKHMASLLIHKGLCFCGLCCGYCFCCGCCGCSDGVFHLLINDTIMQLYRLLLGGIVLENNKTLHDYGIQPKTVLGIVVKDKKQQVKQ